MLALLLATLAASTGLTMVLARPSPASSNEVLRGQPTTALASPATTVGPVAWGHNASGQLGVGSFTGPEKCSEAETPCSRTPVAVSGLRGVAAMAAGFSHSLALLRNGTVMAWGANEFGELGTGTTTNSDVPLAVGGLTEAMAIAGSLSDSMALLKTGTVMDWGANFSGQLGNGTETRYSSVPVAVQGLSGVTAIAAGGEFSLALLSNGTVMAWGNNYSGELGTGTTTNSDVPVAVKGLSEVVAISAGAAHSLALLRNGTVMAWGYNASLQLGTTEGGGYSDVPVLVRGVSGATAVAAGGYHSLALLSNGTAMAWGANFSGQLGNGSQGGDGLAEPVKELSGATAIAAGHEDSMALVGGGAVMTWGGNEWGELGTGAMTNSDVPVSVSGLSGVRSIAVGGAHCLAAAPELPSVASVEPDDGRPTGGTVVTITGAGFAGAAAVHFGARDARSFTVDSPTSITAISPKGHGRVDVTVTTPGGTSATSAADQFAYGHAHA